MHSYADYRLYVHPVLSHRMLRTGFSWVALVLGPFWLLVKKQWLSAAIVVLLVLGAYAALEHYYPHIDMFFFGQTVGDAWRDFGSPEQRAEYADYIPEGRTQRWEYLKLLITLIANVVVACIGPVLYERNLLARGYVLRGTVRARTMEEALGLLAQSKAFLPTSPAAQMDDLASRASRRG